MTKTDAEALGRPRIKSTNAKQAIDELQKKHSEVFQLLDLIDGMARGAGADRHKLSQLGHSISSAMQTIKNMTIYALNDLEKWGSSYKEHYLAAEKRAAVPVELRNVAEQLTEKSGFWRHCTGCLEMNEGYPVGHYPYSEVFKCQIGSGCSECGGIGAVWDNTDYEEMAKALEPQPAQPVEGESIERLVINAMQMWWDDHVADTGNCPPDIIFEGPKRIRFEAASWASTVAKAVAEKILRQPVAAPADDAMVNQIVEQVCRDVAELPDRTSPDNHPNMMLVSYEELTTILRAALTAALAQRLKQLEGGGDGTP